MNKDILSSITRSQAILLPNI